LGNVGKENDGTKPKIVVQPRRMKVKEGWLKVPGGAKPVNQSGRPVLGEIANTKVPVAGTRPGNAALKKQADEAGGKLQLQEKTRGEEKKLLPPGKLVAEVGKVVTREKGGSQEEKEDKEKKESKGEEEQYENRKEGTREDCQSKGVAEEKSEVKAEKEKDPTISKANVNERVEGKEVVEGEKEERVTGAAGEVLPVGVVDVDAYCDNREPHLCSEYACSIYIYLRQLEAGNIIKKDFLKGTTIVPRMRAVLIDWLVEVHTQFGLLQETLYMAIYLIDRYLQCEGLVIKSPKTKLQLIGVTAMFIAAKVEEMYAPDLLDFVYITDGASTAEEVKACELKILSALNFNVTRPHSLHFLRRNSKAGDANQEQHNLAKFLMECTIGEYELAHQPPSLLASASLLLALKLTNTPSETFSQLWTNNLEYYSTYTCNDLVPIVKRVAAAVVKQTEAGTSTLAVARKYKAKKFGQVTNWPEVRGEMIKRIAKMK